MEVRLSIVDTAFQLRKGVNHTPQDTAGGFAAGVGDFAGRFFAHRTDQHPTLIDRLRPRECGHRILSILPNPAKFFKLKGITAEVGNSIARR